MQWQVAGCASKGTKLMLGCFVLVANAPRKLSEKPGKKLTPKLQMHIKLTEKANIEI